MTKQISPRDWEALSAYLDGQLTPKERQKLEARLQLGGDLRSALEELRRTRAVVRAHLPMRSPRNFTLTPAMAGLPFRKRPDTGWFPALRLASALSSLLFVFIVLGDVLLGNRLPPVLTAEERQPILAPAAVESAPLVAQAPATEVPLQAETQPTPEALAKGLVAPNPTSEALVVAPPAAPLTDTFQAYEKGVGAGGGGPEDTGEQTALSEMAPSATATPLPTPTITPSPTLVVIPTLEGSTPGIRGTNTIAWLPGRPVWRWLEVTLAIMGITTGLVAFYLSRFGRS
jgi:anti-sigma factor RsiW